jgi:hypothetical protein
MVVYTCLEVKGGSTMSMRQGRVDSLMSLRLRGVKTLFLRIVIVTSLLLDIVLFIIIIIIVRLYGDISW